MRAVVAFASVTGRRRGSLWAYLAQRKAGTVSDGPLQPSNDASDRARYYTKTHEWFQMEDKCIGTVGITQTAQRALGEILYCRLPREGEQFNVMDTIVTLEALKSVGEVKSPVYGTVLEVNPRLKTEPGLVTVAPLTEGWLVRLEFDGHVPQYLRGGRVVSRGEVEDMLADLPAFQAFVLQRFGDAGSNEALEELTFDGLRPMERLWVHKAVNDLDFTTFSHGKGPGRKLVVRRQPPTVEEGLDGNVEIEDERGDGYESGKNNVYRGRRKRRLN